MHRQTDDLYTLINVPTKNIFALNYIGNNC